MRLRDLTTDQMSAEQRAVAEEAASGKRGRMPAPLRAWIHSPEFGRRAQRLGEFLRYDTSLPPILSELAILVTGRHWMSHYEWYAHKHEALKAGIDPKVIADIAVGAVPSFTDPAARLVHDYCQTLLRSGRVSDDIHAEAQAQLSETGVAELVGIIGYYSLVALTLNAFDIGLPEGELPELQPLEQVP